jgi:hypothetical protein
MRPTGWIPERPGAQILGAHDFEQIGSFPAEGGFDAEPWILDQFGESCTGHVAAQWDYLLTGEKGSPYFPWYWARVWDSGPDMVFDVGASLGAVKMAFEKHGICPWDEWNPTLPHFEINGVPPALSRMKAQKKNLDVTVLYDSGRELAERVASELSRGRPCAFVAVVDAAMSNYRGGVLERAKSGGGFHIMTIQRYRTRNGRIEVGGPNSWNRFWGEDGWYWADEERLAQAPAVVSCRGAS